MILYPLCHCVTSPPEGAILTATEHLVVVNRKLQLPSGSPPMGEMACDSMGGTGQRGWDKGKV